MGRKPKKAKKLSVPKAVANRHAGMWLKAIQDNKGLNAAGMACVLGVSVSCLRTWFTRSKLPKIVAERIRKRIGEELPEDLIGTDKKTNPYVPFDESEEEEEIEGDDEESILKALILKVRKERAQAKKPRILRAKNLKKDSKRRLEWKRKNAPTLELIRRMSKKAVETLFGQKCAQCGVTFDEHNEPYVLPGCDMLVCSTCFGISLRGRRGMRINNVIFDTGAIKAAFIRRRKALKRAFHPQTLGNLLRGVSMEDAVYVRFCEVAGIPIEKILREPYRSMFIEEKENKENENTTDE